MLRTLKQCLNTGMSQARIGFPVIELDKVAGAVLTFLLTVWVIGMIGDGLVHPRLHPAASVAVKAPAATPAPKEEPKLEPVGPLLAAADPAKGQQIFKKCAACHSSEKSGGKKIGPNLWNIVNAKTARSEDFSYSKALREKGENWGYEQLNAFLAKPKAYVPGTKMVFAGIKNVSERADLIAYLRSLSDSPAPLP